METVGVSWFHSSWFHNLVVIMPGIGSWTRPPKLVNTCFKKDSTCPSHQLICQWNVWLLNWCLPSLQSRTKALREEGGGSWVGAIHFHPLCVPFYFVWYRNWAGIEICVLTITRYQEMYLFQSFPVAGPTDSVCFDHFEGYMFTNWPVHSAISE